MTATDKGEVRWGRAKMLKIIYVDVCRGNDETGDGSKNLPFRTMDRAIKECDDAPVLSPNGTISR